MNDIQFKEPQMSDIRDRYRAAPGLVVAVASLLSAAAALSGAALLLT